MAPSTLIEYLFASHRSLSPKRRRQIERWVCSFTIVFVLIPLHSRCPAPITIVAAIDHAGETSPELENAIEASSIQAFAFDFDLTLSNIHVYNQRVAPAHVHYRWRDDIPCPEELSAILRAISAAGRSWCVVTFGQPPVVTAYLEALGFTKEEISVHSPLSGNQVRLLCVFICHFLVETRSPDNCLDSRPLVAPPSATQKLSAHLQTRTCS